VAILLGVVRTSIRALGTVGAYAATVGAVLAAVVLTADSSATPWLALLAAMAIVHLGFGLIVARFWVALLPVVVAVVAWLLNLGDLSILTLLVGVPCAMLVVAGAALRIGWDGGPRAGARESKREKTPAVVAEIRAERRRAAASRDADDDWDPVQPMRDEPASTSRRPTSTFR
jgi:hypothetical protein